MSASRFCSLLKPTSRPTAWLDSLATMSNRRLGILSLRPEVFCYAPNIGLMHRIVDWQKKYRTVDYRWTPTRADIAIGRRKPWAQKGSGRPRHGNRNVHLFKGRAVFGGPRGPRSHFFMPPKQERCAALCATLSMKYAEDNLRVVDSFSLPSSNPDYLRMLMEIRGWGTTALFIDETDDPPNSIVDSTSLLTGHTVMPLYGLNCYSMLKHEALIITKPALDLLQKRILAVLLSPQYRNKLFSEDDLL